MNAVEQLWQPPAEIELWLILLYVAGVLVAARVLEAVAKSHFARAQRHAVHGFEYVAPRDYYTCLGSATLTLDTIHANERMAIYRAPVDHCGGCHLKPTCAPKEASRRLYRSLATWAETDVGRFHQYVALLMFFIGGILSAAGLWKFLGQPGTGYLALAFATSCACLALHSRRLRFQTNEVHATSAP